MIIFLFGPDSYRRQQKQNEIINQYKKKYSALSLRYLDLERGEDGEALRDNLYSTSLFDKPKMLVVKNPFASKMENLQSLLRDKLTDEEIVLLLISEDLPPKEYSFLLEKPVTSQPFDLLKGEKLKNFIALEGQKRNVSLTTKEINDLLDEYGSDLWSVATEIEKVSLASLKNNIVQKNFAQDGFKLIMELIAAQPSRRVTALEQLLSKDDPAKIFNILAAVAKGEIKTQLARYDILIKSGKLDYETALLDLVIN